MLAVGPDLFLFLHFYFEIFYIIIAFSTFASNVSYSGIKKYIIIGPNVRQFCFRVDLLPPRTCALSITSDYELTDELID